VPIFSRIFKALGLYDQDYHDKYRQYIKEKRYKKFLEMVRLDMYTGLLDLKFKLDAEKKIKETFPEPPYIIHYPED
jgi:hypothetical protein